MINAKLNNMFFDAMLEVAGGEIMNERIAEWDTLNTVEHEFSPEFEQNMRKLLHRHTRHLRMKSVKKALKRVAIFIIAFMAVGFTLTMSVQALRVQFFNTIREFTEEYIGFTFSGNNAEQSTDGLIRSDYLPEGYREESVEVLLSGTCIRYIDDAGNRISFYQQTQDEGLNVWIDNEHTKSPYDLEINGLTIQVYERVEEGYSSYLIWDDDGLFCSLSGSIVTKELIKMVESLK